MQRTVSGPLTIVLASLATVLALAQCGPARTTGHPLTPASVAGEFPPPGSGDPAQEAAALQDLAKAFQDFHDDTAGWPFGLSAWYPQPGLSAEIWPGLSFSDRDTAMFALPPDISNCDQTHTGGLESPCWNGPYLKMTQDEVGSSLAHTRWLDAWGHPRLFSYVRPYDGMGGGIDRPQSQNGLIYIWSRGPDGLDGFTCSDAGGDCHEVDINAYVNGHCSQLDCDDIVVEVSPTAF